MHTTYFVKIAKEEAKTAQEALDAARSALDGNNFAGESGFFGGSKADWYSIGGRASGALTYVLNPKKKALVDAEAQKLIDADLNAPDSKHKSYANKKSAKKGEMCFTDADTLAINDHIGSAKLRKELETLYQKYLGVPFARGGFHGEFTDDAQVITPALRKALKADQWLKECEVFLADDYEEVLVKKLTSKDDGAWLVVVDYHN